jgi:hypothetical protein
MEHGVEKTGPGRRPHARWEPWEVVGGSKALSFALRGSWLSSSPRMSQRLGETQRVVHRYRPAGHMKVGA